MSFDLPQLIHTFGYIGLSAIVFAESGLFVGFFLPGDSLLFSAGILASQGFLNVWVLCTVLFISAVLGDSVGYAFGHRYGRHFFNSESSFFFNKRFMDRAEAFFERHGKKTIIIARFVPIVRTFTPIVAGFGKMHYKTFLVYNLIGGGLWTLSITLLGYFLGRTVPHIDRYLTPAVILIVVASILQPTYHIFREPQNRANAKAQIKSLLRLS